MLLLQDEFLQTVWDREPSLLSLGDMEGELEPSRRELRQLPSFNSTGSFSLPEDYRWGHPSWSSMECCGGGWSQQRKPA